MFALAGVALVGFVVVIGGDHPGGVGRSLLGLELEAADGFGGTAAAHDDALEVTFPLPRGVEGVRYDAESFHETPPRFGADRGTRLYAPYGTPVFAMAGGIVSSVNAEKGRVVVRVDEGGMYSYDNLSGTVEDLERGRPVGRGQLIGWVGCSGDADCGDPFTRVAMKGASSSPYTGRYFNAYHSLEAAESRGDHAEALEAEGPPSSPSRVGGRTRTGTAVELSRWAFPSSDAVVLASRSDFPDALAAGALAGALDAPLLLVDRDTLGRVNALEISRLGAQEAWIVGGTATVSDAVVEELINETRVPPDGVRRLAGSDRFATAAKIAEEVIALTDPESAIVVSGRDYADALSASALGAATGLPVLLTDGERLPGVTAEVLGARGWGGPIYLAAGTATISGSVESAIADAAWTDVRRLAGDDRWDTSALMADIGASLVGEPTQVLVGSGHSWPDGLAAGPAAARRGAAFVIVNPSDVTRSAPTSRWLQERSGRIVDSRFVGGRGALSEDVAEQTVALLRREPTVDDSAAEREPELRTARIAGSDRTTTAVTLARWAFGDGGADAVVVASRSDYPDALAAGPLAAALDAPVLLTGADGLGTANLHAIERLGASEVWIVGGSAVVSEAVEDELRTELGLSRADIRRVAGSDRYATAAAIAEEVIRIAEPESAIVVSGADYVDALSASALGAATGSPVLLTRAGALPDPTTQVLASRSWEGPIYLAGGSAVIDVEVEQTAAETATTDVERLAGEGRYATSVALAELGEGLRGEDVTEVGLATGENWPDALAAGPALAHRGAAFLIVDPRDLSASAASERWLVERARWTEGLNVIGGVGAIEDTVIDQLRSMPTTGEPR